MTDANTARLCETIIRTDFGPLAGTVASVLLSRGRLPLSHVVRFSKLKPRTVRAAILVLVQHNILWHAETDVEGEVLEFNVDECLTRIRYGRLRRLYNLCLDHGKLRPPEIISRLSITDTVKAPAIYSQALHKLVEGSYLKPSTVLSHISPRDKRIKYEAEEKLKIPGFPTAKQLREVKEIVDSRLKREEEEAEKIGMKRKAKDQPIGRSSKRKAVEEDAVDEHVYFKVNCERFNCHIRNQIIEEAAKERHNAQAALVMRAVLKASEAKQLHLSDVRSDPVNLGDVAAHLSDEEDLSEGFVLQSSKKPSEMSLLKDYCGILASADNPTPAGLASSFITLNGSKVQVEFDIISKRLKRRILESVARERHGDAAVRIIRLLLQTGKMDEKQISKIGMMSPKESRPLLASMSAEALISTQEVAKTADRNPARTFYLWYVDLQKTYAVLLGILYKTLHNIAARRQAEEDEPVVKAVLEKRQRTDVMQDEERLLTRNEREVLAQWEKKRTKLAILEQRVEEGVFILRDFGSPGINDE
ncbi:hypothetical protein QCA50_002850 [Cerrena zonata]|uniref:DNA-directed RNA polymerase III subunit RPC3 n=1 Tax=Cerrena zonata TaxID=2478898 RepID=A0AAW0GHZ4_9APHY